MRIAVITGGSSGIGAALARTLTKRGWRCVLLARSAERLDRVAEEIGAEAEPCDVGDRGQVDGVAQRIADRHGVVHLLVNNAGFTRRKGFLASNPDETEELVRTNYLGSVWSLHAFLPLLEADLPSDVVNVVSVAGTVAHGGSGPYAATKHAQLAFSRATTVELAPRGIRVHTVNPGPVETLGFPQGDLRGRRGRQADRAHARRRRAKHRARGRAEPRRGRPASLPARGRSGVGPRSGDSLEARHPSRRAIRRATRPRVAPATASST